MENVRTEEVEFEEIDESEYFEPHYLEKWRSHDTIRFLEEYSHHPCLWNIHHPKYNNKECRENALRDIVNVINIPQFDLPEARKKIRSLRSTYGLERLKIERGKRNNRPYQTKIPWFGLADRFLKDVSDQLKTKLKSRNKLAIACKKLKSLQRRTSQYPKRQIIIKKVPEESEDEFTIFGKHIVAHLQQLPKMDAMELENQINTIIMKRRVEVLKNMRNVKRRIQTQDLCTVSKPVINLDQENHQ